MYGPTYSHVLGISQSSVVLCSHGVPFYVYIGCCPHGISTYLPSKIICFVALKRKARATWQKTHAPDDRRLFNNATNKLKTALHSLRNENFTTYVSSLSNSDHSVWKPIKSRIKPRLQFPQFVKIPHHRVHGPKLTMIKSSSSRAI